MREAIEKDEFEAFRAKWSAVLAKRIWERNKVPRRLIGISKDIPDGKKRDLSDMKYESNRTALSKEQFVKENGMMVQNDDKLVTSI